MTNYEVRMTNETRMTKIENPERSAGSRPRPGFAFNPAATGVRHGKDANLVAERR